MIVSNIRIAEHDWLQVKAAAGDLGMSVNEYLNCALERFTTMRELSTEEKERKTKSSIWDLPKMAKRIKTKPLGLSREDEEIYAI